ncbi:hypothetical protein RIF29_27846 [Crotalaria pallida]|uniref:Pentatricopeptide repeat protein n=1 Tax=Crotalaria pallida TaxID=3830 RepID=A0AAN9I0U1_CROPI
MLSHHPSSHNHYTFTHALKACYSLHAPSKALEIHAHLVKSGHYSDIFIQNSLLHFYFLHNDVVSAARVFHSIASPDVVSWTSFISGLSKCGFESEAIERFSLMGVKPNVVTLVSVLSACSGLKALKFGKAIHGYGLKGLIIDGNVIFDNALLDLYAKCGALANAEKLFVKMPKRDVVSWTTLVMAYAQGGHCEEAVDVFKRMVLEGDEVKPNEATVVTVLSACASMGSLSLGQWVHSYVDKRRDLEVDGNIGNALVNIHEGLVSEGIMFFKAMRDAYGIVPQMRHYGCMVDMYGRAGLFEEAKAFLKGMPVEAEGPVWGALLQACKNHGNEKMSEWIRSYLNNKDVGIGTLALLSNLYASSERWDDANKVRTTMRGNGLKKKAGCSWIELETSINILDSDLCVA